MNKKVLILSRSFRAGDAITTLNLFSRCPKSNLYCVSMVETEFALNFNEYYVLGNDEVLFRFPFTNLVNIGKSHIATDKSVANDNKKTLKRIAYENLLLPVLQCVDLYETRYKILLSDKLEKWIVKISPDIIYTSIGDIPMAHFVLEIHRRFPNIKIAIHGFDDWLSPTYKILNGARHRKQAEILLKKNLDIATYRFTSSEKMALEYENRYGYVFRCFPNPVKLNTFHATAKKSLIPNIVFAGKIGWHNNLAIKDMVAAVDNLNRKGIKVQFDIYTDCTLEQVRYFLGVVADSTVIHKPVSNMMIPSILAAAHALFLPISISAVAERFTRYSMSTKMGEYLSSGVPIIYCGPSSIAMTEFFGYKNCTVVVERPGEQYMEEALIKVLAGSEEISKMCDRGIELAKSYFNIELVSQDFANVLGLWE
mgnify:FL=1